jgi:hypothetical protein
LILGLMMKKMRGKVTYDKMAAFLKENKNQEG